jgi:N-acetylglucosamine-6-phosphate deacetylase
MSPLGSREPGAVGAAIASPRAWCGLIADGFHVHPASLAIAVAAKPRGKCLLVTDAMPPVGAEDPGFSLYGQRIEAMDGRCATADGILAGSALDMATAVRNAVALIGVTPEEALRMASLYPAEFLGITDRGRLAPGFRADLAALDPAGRVIRTWIDGSSA